VIGEILRANEEALRNTFPFTLKPKLAKTGVSVD
jgi:hypothetical protein